MAELQSVERAQESLTATPAMRGVVVVERNALGMATVLARKGRNDELSRRIREHFGIELPTGPRRVTEGEVSFACTGPGSWLATHETAAYALAFELAELLEGLASISDQSDAYLVLRLSGPAVRDTLRKLVPIDVHPRAFRAGDIASTLAAHVGAMLWRLEDEAAGTPVFEIAVYRSFAASFRHALQEAGADFGL